jgi:hypothetical protein
MMRRLFFQSCERVTKCTWNDGKPYIFLLTMNPRFPVCDELRDENCHIRGVVPLSLARFFLLVADRLQLGTFITALRFSSTPQVTARLKLTPVMTRLKDPICRKCSYAKVEAGCSYEEPSTVNQLLLAPCSRPYYPFLIKWTKCSQMNAQ